MKNRIDACFEKLKAENKKALVTFITAGDPDMDTTEKCVLEMYKNGSDIIEIGVPFSDPIAEGATIQKASLRSLSGGTNLDKIFDLVRKLRTQTDKPMLLMMYINTIFKFGTAKFFELCKETQIDGVIVPDMPFEEREELEGEAEKNGIYTIFLVAPTSHERVKMIAEKSKGFLYVVSSLGVTGMRSEITTDFNELLAPIRNENHCPCWQRKCPNMLMALSWEVLLLKLLRNTAKTLLNMLASLSSLFVRAWTTKHNNSKGSEKCISQSHIFMQKQDPDKIEVL